MRVGFLVLAMLLTATSTAAASPWWNRLVEDAESVGLLMPELEERSGGVLVIRYSNRSADLEEAAVRRLLSLVHRDAPASIRSVVLERHTQGLPLHAVTWQRGASLPGGGAPPPRVIQPSSTDIRELPAQSTATDRLDRLHDGVFLGVQRTIAAADARFADPDEAPLVVPVSPFRLGLQGGAVYQGNRWSLEPRLDLDLLLQMPHLQRRLKVYVTSDATDESPADIDRGNNALRAGLRLLAARDVELDLGVRADVPPVAHLSLRWQRRFVSGDWQLHPFAKPYLESGDGFGVAWGASLDRWWGPVVARAGAYANWRQETGDTEWVQVLTLARAREVLRSGRYSQVVSGRDLARGYGAQVLVEGSDLLGRQRYEASLFLKQPMGRDWLYWNITPLVRWEARHDWRADPGIRIGVDALFWGLAGENR